MPAPLPLLSLGPFALVCAAAVTVLLGIAWQRMHTVSALVTIVGLLGALVLQLALQTPDSAETPLLVFDGLSHFAALMVLGSSLVVALLSHTYLRGYTGPREEFYLLLLCAAAGALILVASQHLASLFFGLELLSMPLYGMLAYRFQSSHSLEAGLKYLILSAAGSAFLLFGMALLYAQTGALDFTGLASEMGPWALAGTGLMLVGLGFKLSIVPFHLWTPDVYQGGPVPATMLLASISKLAVFVVLLRLVLEVPTFRDEALSALLAGLAILTMIVGNLLALRQSDLKRLLGYSSIAHFGYLLVALVIGSRFAVETAGVYLITYLVATLTAFGVVTLLSSPCRTEEASNLEHYRGLFWRRPWLAAALTVAMLSLAGIPFTAGFIGKFYILALAVDAQRWWLVAAVIAGSAIGLYYYLRVMVALFLREAADASRAGRGGHWLNDTIVLVLALLVIVLGVWPAPAVDWLAGLNY
ncbi:NADH-quinone oxidoreductase subunit NuoN [Marinimicrobium agarilyticum]|uniref:NADH-quinone oxidoreductase subunit NuoN n=1 Tax=Marinimicrobium agarilyticum TaxID=306546 RepID=UPI00041A3867|nr:NADH-quinone oxidoreductase subunit NuoN [Marinimicrobium agarilyticum]